MTTTPEPATERGSFGWDVGPSDYGPRGIVSAPEKSMAGNVILHVGNESGDKDGGWYKVAHVVLTPEETVEFIAALQAQL